MKLVNVWLILNADVASRRHIDVLGKFGIHFMFL